MRFTIDNKHIIKWMWVKKLCRKTLCPRCFWQKMNSWWDKDTDQNISARSLTLLCSGLGIVWSTTTQTWITDATAVTFSVKCFNPLKLYPLSGNIFRTIVVCFILFFIYSRTFNKYWSPTVNLIAGTTLLLTSGLHHW